MVGKGDDSRPQTPDVNFAIEALNYHNEDLLKIMMANNVNPSCSMNYDSGQSMLQYAVMKGDLEKVKFLLPYCSRKGINHKDKKGRTAFYLSINTPIYFHSLLITKALFNKFANPNEADNNGQTPLHRACILAEPLFVQELLTRACRVDLKDIEGRIPLECCREVCVLDVSAVMDCNACAFVIYYSQPFGLKFRV